MYSPFFIYKIIKSIDQNFSPIKILGLSISSILIVGPTFGFFQEYRKDKELKKHGKETVCIVVDKKKSKNVWLINCKYEVNNSELITYYHTDEENKYKVGDTLKLVYNKEFPTMYKIDF